MAWWARAEDGALLIRIHAQPGARRTESAGLHGEALKVRVAAPPSEDRANDALIAFVAARLGAAVRDVTIVSGGKSREKRVRVLQCTQPPEALLE